jgi:hypothetical protein
MPRRLRARAGNDISVNRIYRSATILAPLLLKPSTGAAPHGAARSGREPDQSGSEPPASFLH